MTMTPADLNGVSEPGQEADPGAKAKRRSFTTEYKLAVVEEYDAGNAEARGALLRRERLHTSHISEWRRKRDAGTLAGTNGGPRKAGAGQAELDRLRTRSWPPLGGLVAQQMAASLRTCSSPRCSQKLMNSSSSRPCEVSLNPNVRSIAR